MMSFLVHIHLIADTISERNVSQNFSAVESQQRNKDIMEICQQVVSLNKK
jgi:hypothetical protein